MDSYRRTAHYAATAGLKLLDAYAVMRNVFPEDAHLRCNGRVFISITVLEFKAGVPVLRNVLRSRFDSRDDLMDACMASSAIPFLSETGWGRRYRGSIVFDGGLLNNVPRFRDGARRQLVCTLAPVTYPAYSSFMCVIAAAARRCA